jgi:hypothetical protein
MKNFSNSVNKIILWTFLSLFLSSVAAPLFAQQVKTNQQFLVWQRRVDALSDGIVKDSSSLTDTERAVYLALLAKIWWKANLEEAKPFLQKSAKLAINSLESEDKLDLAAKIKNTQKVIQIIAGIDEKLSLALLKQFIKITVDKGKNDGQNGDTLVSIALQVVEVNPQLAYEIGIKSLGYGNPHQITRLIGELNNKDTKLAEQLFLAALNNARNKYDFQYLSRLSVRAFANFSKGRPMSDLARRSYLIVLAEVVARASANAQEKQDACEIIIVATPLIDQFDLYLPELVQTIKQQIQVCQPFTSKANSASVDSNLSNDRPKTAEELISASRNTDDRFLKLKYTYEAIVKLAAANKFDDILSFLDSLTNREKEIIGNDSAGSNTWENWYEENAFSSVMQYIKNKDLASAYRIINRVPKRVRPSVRVSLAFNLPADEYQTFILENLEDARKEINSIDISPIKRADYFLALTLLYVKAQPLESEGVFRETVKAINSADGENPDFVPEKDYAPLRDYIKLPFELLEIDESNIFSSFADISSRRSRVRLKLGLLESSLQKYLIEKKKVELENKKQSGKTL